ncbi:MAG: glycoside hydrolase family 125 protein [Velocimicrobium sp.]
MSGKNKYQSVEQLIAKVYEEIPDSKIARTFENCFNNTLNKTVEKQEDGSVFVITGDIPAMWLRDSVCQLRPYLVLANQDEQILELMEGLVKKQFSCIMEDPYANAFNQCANGHGFQDDVTAMKPALWERKYEIDSLCFPIQFSYLLWKNAGTVGHFTAEWKTAVEKVMEVFHIEQYHETKSNYRFERRNCLYTDTLSRSGKGALVKEGTGLVWSGFRPSDDACTYGYLIPSNMFLSVVMQYVGEIAKEVYKDHVLESKAIAFSQEIQDAIERYAVVPCAKKPYYAYEVDGFGQYLTMDDANVPSLLAMPYFGYCKNEDRTYQNTKEVILSDANPYYYKGSQLEGIGSPHTPVNYVWHISLAMQGLVSDSKEEKYQILQKLSNTDGGAYMMHESVYVNDVTTYTRPWFSWANAMFSELTLDYLGYHVKTKG